MTTGSLSYEFIRSHASLTWREAHWGYEHGLIGWDALKELAGDKLCQGSEASEEIELAGLTAGEAYEAGDLAKRLAAKEPSAAEGQDQRVWLFLCLADLYLRRNEVEDALAEVEAIYADYGYPEEIEGFVRFMPATDGYDPLRHSHEENLERLYRKWEQYLQAETLDRQKNS